MVSTLLEGLGYSVLTARDADDAITKASTGQNIGLLLTDVVMPRMSGRELADRLTEKRPSLKVLFMSGYNDDDVLRYGVEQGSADLLPKPFTPDQLAERVRAALGRD